VVEPPVDVLPADVVPLPELVVPAVVVPDPEDAAEVVDPEVPELLVPAAEPLPPVELEDPEVVPEGPPLEQPAAAQRLRAQIVAFFTDTPRFPLNELERWHGDCLKAIVSSPQRHV
jgi:hypothetical protein